VRAIQGLFSLFFSLFRSFISFYDFSRLKQNPQSLFTGEYATKCADTLEHDPSRSLLISCRLWHEPAFCKVIKYFSLISNGKKSKLFQIS
jgi:hypothetical protein